MEAYNHFGLFNKFFDDGWPARLSPTDIAVWFAELKYANWDKKRTDVEIGEAYPSARTIAIMIGQKTTAMVSHSRRRLCEHGLLIPKDVKGGVKSAHYFVAVPGLTPPISDSDTPPISDSDRHPYRIPIPDQHIKQKIEHPKQQHQPFAAAAAGVWELLAESGIQEPTRSRLISELGEKLTVDVLTSIIATVPMRKPRGVLVAQIRSRAAEEYDRFCAVKPATGISEEFRRLEDRKLKDSLLQQINRACSKADLSKLGVWMRLKNKVEAGIIGIADAKIAVRALCEEMGAACPN